MLARNSVAAVKLCDFKILGTEPGFVDSLEKEKNQKYRWMTIALSLLEEHAVLHTYINAASESKF